MSNRKRIRHQGDRPLTSQAAEYLARSTEELRAIKEHTDALHRVTADLGGLLVADENAVSEDALIGVANEVRNVIEAVTAAGKATSNVAFQYSGIIKRLRKAKYGAN